MKAMTIAAALALSTGAMAADTTMTLEGRFNYESTEEKNAGVKTTSGTMSGDFLRLGIGTRLNETVTGKLVLDVLGDSVNSGTNNGFNKFVNEFSLTKSFGVFSASIGKMEIGTGGRQSDVSARDQYLNSTWDKTFVTKHTGVAVDYAVMGVKLNAQYLQQDASNANSQGASTDKRIMGLKADASLMDGMITPVASYHITQGDNKTTLIAVGTGVNVAGVAFSADYLMAKSEDYAAQGTDGKLNTMVFEAGYQIQNFKPFAKYIMETAKNSDVFYTNGSQKAERTAWELGVEFKPVMEEDMRAHLVYSSGETKDKASTNYGKIEETTILAGVAFGFDLLK